jgi:hypothetical protein
VSIGVTGTATAADPKYHEAMTVGTNTSKTRDRIGVLLSPSAWARA